MDMGWDCPDRQTTADFLTSLTNPAERIPKAGFENRVPRTPDEFGKAWETSSARLKLLADIENFENVVPLHGQEIENMKKARKTQQSSLM